MRNFMPERVEIYLKVLSLIVGLIFLSQFARLMTKRSPLHGYDLPATMLSASLQPAPDANGATPSGKPPEISSAARQQADRIRESEIFGPVQKPLPMALLGIAGPDVFLRGPNGQTGLLREGDQLGGVKLVRVGVNRVVVEQDGELKELMIFGGFGGETLLLKEKEGQP
jgi:hypothetical protein